ncbi:MAG: 30S ribosomal protein S11 [Weeping tea tree witches'-broom phytoplasma]|uniref:30S ribosomal protein S11 n=1 Tax=Candidatus Phytoplasma melaleucae TaxID=2982630 RepID=UPI00293B6C69|nr:30S ribosomal protein S11 [Weeping tea tree witches'-broom phytoplasma]
MKSLTKQVKRKKIKKNVPAGIVHIHSTFNNTIINVTDLYGNSIVSCSAGKLGFDGSRKSTFYSAQQVAKKVALLAKDYGMQKVEIWVKGPGVGRETAIRTFNDEGFKISVIKDVTPIPHNGCRPPKRPRG